PADLARVEHPPAGGPWPTMTVAVCTRDRPDDLARCLAALESLDYPALDVLVVDNAPTGPATQQLVEAHHPRARYVPEPRPGLDWARIRAILVARGEDIALTVDADAADSTRSRLLAVAFRDGSR